MKNALEKKCDQLNDSNSQLEIKIQSNEVGTASRAFPPPP